jgi:hypothetical protein
LLPRASDALRARHDNLRQSEGRDVERAPWRDGQLADPEEGVPAYLESTNGGNDHRYSRAGFLPIGVVPGGPRRHVDQRDVARRGRHCRPGVSLELG